VAAPQYGSTELAVSRTPETAEMPPQAQGKAQMSIHSFSRNERIVVDRRAYRVARLRPMPTNELVTLIRIADQEEVETSILQLSRLERDGRLVRRDRFARSAAAAR
jgi:hypothetical protein